MYIFFRCTIPGIGSLFIKFVTSYVVCMLLPLRRIFIKGTFKKIKNTDCVFVWPSILANSVCDVSIWTTWTGCNRDCARWNPWMFNPWMCKHQVSCGFCFHMRLINVVGKDIHVHVNGFIIDILRHLWGEFKRSNQGRALHRLCTLM